MSNSKENRSICKTLKSRVWQAIEEESSSSNQYEDDMLDLRTAKNYSDVIEEILKKKRMDETNRKNDREWTPLMQAIRNGNTDVVKILLANGYSPNKNSYKEISPIGLAAAMGLKMFETVYNACPAALDYAKNNYISPLCAAVMKEDTELLQRLLELGVDFSEANACTLMLMRQSRIPEIAKFAEAVDRIKKNNWTENASDATKLNDDINNPGLSSTLDNMKNTVKSVVNADECSTIPEICVTPPCDGTIDDGKHFDAFVVDADDSRTIDDEEKSLTTMRFIYNRERTFSALPNSSWLVDESETSKSHDISIGDDLSGIVLDDFFDFEYSTGLLNSTFKDDRKIHKYKINRPPDLNISRNDSGCLEYTSENEKSNSESSPSGTPVEHCYETPPAAMVLDHEQQKIAVTLQRFGLTRFIITFLQQEVDLELFLTLNDQDLREIGIASKSDRRVVLSVIAECNRYQMPV